MPRIKTRICAYSLCKKEFKPTYSTFQVCCSVGCSIQYNKKKETEKRVKKMKADLKTHKDYLGILQAVFNSYIRERDRDKGCISCSKPFSGKFDAGHFHSVGKVPNLRFDEDNVHGQCVYCNQHQHGAIAKYAFNLPKRIGWEKFEALYEKANGTLKLSIPEIKELIVKYKTKTKELRNG